MIVEWTDMPSISHKQAPIIATYPPHSHPARHSKSASRSLNSSPSQSRHSKPTRNLDSSSQSIASPLQSRLQPIAVSTLQVNQSQSRLSEPYGTFLLLYSLHALTPSG